MSDGGKGSKQRPSAVASEEFASNWDKIFGKKPTESDTPAETETVLDEPVED